MRTAALAVACWLMCARPVIAAEISPGASPSLVKQILAQPMTQLRSGNEEQWEYETPRGVVTLRFLDGELTFEVPLFGHSHHIVLTDADEMYRQARGLADAGNLHDATVLLGKCLETKPKHRRCRNLHEELKPVFARELTHRFQQARGGDHLSRKAVLEEMLELAPDSPNIRAALVHENAVAEQNTRLAIQSLLDVKAAAVAARDLANKQNFHAAADTLKPFATFRLAAPAVKELERLALTFYRGRLSSGSLIELNSAVRDVQRLAAVVSEAARAVFRNDAQAVAIDYLVRTVARVETPARARAYREALISQFSNLFPEPPPHWPKVERPVSDDVHVKRSVGCGRADLVVPPDVLTLARQNARTAMRVELDFDCDVNTEVTNVEQINSTYVASHQQVANPAYVRLQNSLEEARAKYDEIRREIRQNPADNGWIAAAQVLAVTSAQNNVNRILDELSRTPPFLAEPIKLAYVAERFSVGRSARVSAAITVTDKDSGLSETVHVASDASESGVGYRNVLPADAEGLANRDATLPSDEILLTRAYSKLAREIVRANRELVGHAFLERARTARNDLERLGNVLLASDIAPEVAGQTNIRSAITRLQTTPIDKLQNLEGIAAELQFPKRSKRSFPASPARQALKTVPSARSAMIEKAMRSVVTIETRDGYGSGFFVHAAGFILTNEHVVRGNSKVLVRTADGSEYLGTVVKSLGNPDLALVKVVGAAVDPLPIASGQLPAVGSDILAIGTPKRYEGSVTKGIVSARRKIEGTQYLQIDASINPGNSGGPVLTEVGVVVGVSTWRRADGEAIGFAIAIDEAVPLLAHIR